MDATRFLVTACLGGGLICAGCTLPNPFLTAPSSGPREAQPVKHEEVTADEAGSTSAAAADEPEFGEIQAWAEAIPRVDDLRSRIERHDTFEPTDRAAVAQAQTDSPGELSDSDAGVAGDDEQELATGPLLPEVTETASVEPRAAPEGQSQPPVLNEVTINTRQAIAVPEPGEIQHVETVNAPSSALRPVASLQELLDRLVDTPIDASFKEQLERRILQAVAGNDEEARRPLEMFAADQQELVSGFIELLIYLRDVPGGSMPEALRRARQALRQLDAAVQRVSGLEISSFEICRRVDGFGQYERMEPATFFAGHSANEFVAYTQIADSVSRLDQDGIWVSEFSLRISVLNRLGETVHTFDGENITDRCRSRRSDCFIAPLIRLPASLSPGEYVVKVTVVDRIGQKVAERRSTIRIVARS